MEPSYVFTFSPESGIGPLVFSRHQACYAIHAEDFLRHVLCVNGNVKWCCNSTCIEQIFPVGARNEGYFYAVSIRPVLSQLVLLGIITDEYARFFWQVFYGRYCEVLQMQTQASV